MDAREYDKIADLLCQIMKKIRNLNTTRIPCVNVQCEMYSNLESALKANDKLAEWDNMGWL